MMSNLVKMTKCDILLLVQDDTKIKHHALFMYNLVKIITKFDNVKYGKKSDQIVHHGKLDYGLNRLKSIIMALK